MTGASVKKVFATVPEAAFIGRDEELDAILEHARSEDGGPLMLLSKPAAGSSELLRQAYNRLFADREGVVPFLFEFRPTDRNARQAAVRFLQTFLTQYTAFRKGDPNLVAMTPDVCEIGEMSPPVDMQWMSTVIESCKRDSALNDDASFVRHAFSVPFRASSADTRVFSMIGGTEYCDLIPGDTAIFEDLKDVFASSNLPFLFGGMRRFLANAMIKGVTRFTDHRTVNLLNLDRAESGLLCEELSEITGVATNAQTRDLIGLQLEGSPLLIDALFAAAAERDTALDSFKNVEQLYVEELFNGRLRGFFDYRFDSVSKDSATQRKIVDLVYGAREFSSSAAFLESWNDTLRLEDPIFRRSAALLNSFEFVNSSSNLIATSARPGVFNDYLSMRFRLEVERAPRSAVYAEMITDALKKAPKIMAAYYRKRSSLGLRELLSTFNCQETPISLLFYNVFKDLHKGKPDTEIQTALTTEPERVTLPQIVYSVNTVSVYGKLSKFTDKERSAVAIGFEAGDYTEESQTVWIAAEIDSKLEAEPDLTEFWCDRLEVVAMMSDYRDYRIWLIAPEGFSPEAVEVLMKRNAIGSSRKQVELLINHLDAEATVGSIEPDNAFEFVVPMGEDTELIAAHAVEEIARRHSFGSKQINQIKTALVEACINATEHSHSPDRKIYQRFEVADDKIVITISNRGLRFKGRETKEINPKEGRRGWGLKLMRSLMDEVRFEQVDDGTRISMTKTLKAA